MMQYFKDSEGDVWAYEDDVQEGFIKAELIPMTQQEIDAHINQSYESEITIPRQVTRAQGKAALIQAGIWPSVLSFIDSIEDETEKALALVAINDTTHWQRNSPFLARAADALGVSQEQLDDLFIAASTIEL